MARRSRPLLFLGIGAAIAALYFWRMATAPIYLYHDEVFFAVQAHSVSTTFRDLNGSFLPLYFNMGGIYWCSPEHIYLTALLLRVLPISDGVIRIPSVMMGLVSAFLMYFLGRRVFRSAWFGMLAAVVVALTPALFVTSRFKVESHYPLPFLIGWLLCVFRFEDTRHTRWLFAAGAVLGLGIYSYHASPVMMGLYVVLTCGLLAWSGEARVGRLATLILGFCLVATPYVIFIAAHPEYVGSEMKTYLSDGRPVGLVQSLRQILTWPGLTARLRIYYDYFNPSFLFFSGGSSSLDTTSHAGVFLMPLAVLLPAGIYRILTREPKSASFFLVGLFSAPVAASLVLEPYATRRILFMIPFAALVTVYGVKQFLSSDQRVARLCGIGLLAAIPLCFGYFYADYMGAYRERSAFWFESNVRGALESAIDDATSTDPPPRIFISIGMNQFIEWYWKFYLLKHGEVALEAHTTYFDPRKPAEIRFPAHALVVSEAAARERLVSQPGAGLIERTRVLEPGGEVSFYVWRTGLSEDRAQR
jgi:4-amino-4-deoxy-L-arabinose transferase-like glycosyltransferase